VSAVVAVGFGVRVMCARVPAGSPAAGLFLGSLERVVGGVRLCVGAGCELFLAPRGVDSFSLAGRALGVWVAGGFTGAGCEWAGVGQHRHPVSLHTSLHLCTHKTCAACRCCPACVQRVSSCALPCVSLMSVDQGLHSIMPLCRVCHPTTTVLFPELAASSPLHTHHTLHVSHGGRECARLCGCVLRHVR
jgi:hypothetical protein